MANTVPAYESQDTPPVKPPRRYQMFEMSQSLGNEIKVCNYNPDTSVSPPTLELLQCSSSSASFPQKKGPDEELRIQQIDTLAEELRQTSLKNVNTRKNYGHNNNVLKNDVPEPTPAVKQRSRRPSGQWKITSVTIEESNSNNVRSQSNTAESNFEQVFENKETHAMSSYQQFQENGHVNKFMEGGYQFQHENAQSTIYQEQERITGQQSFQQQSNACNALSSSSINERELSSSNGNQELEQTQLSTDKNNSQNQTQKQWNLPPVTTNVQLQQNMSQHEYTNSQLQQNMSHHNHTNIQLQQNMSQNGQQKEQVTSYNENGKEHVTSYMSQAENANSLFQQNMSQADHTKSQFQQNMSEHKYTNTQHQQNMSQDEQQKEQVTSYNGNGKEQVTNYNGNGKEHVTSYNRNGKEQVTNYNGNDKKHDTSYNGNCKYQVTNYNGNGEEHFTSYNGNNMEQVTRDNENEQQKHQTLNHGKGSIKYLQNYLSLCPKPSEYNNHREEDLIGGHKHERRNSVCQSFINTDQTKSRSSRASSVDPQSRPIFSYLKLGEDPNAHRSRQPSNLTSRRNSTAGLQKYSSKEYLNRTYCDINDLKIRNNPVMLAQPKDMKDDGNSFLSHDGSMYQSTEALNSGTRTRHRSASQSREDKSYTWSGRNSFTGTGLRIGSAITEPEPKDGLALSKDGGFFMPFGNSENISKKCKSRRQLKAEEEMRKRQEEEEERQSLLERQRKKEQRREKRNRNRTVSVSAQNRSNQVSQHSTNMLNNNTLMLNNMEDSTTSEYKANIAVENNSLYNANDITEIENIQVLKKDVIEDTKNKTTCKVESVDTVNEKDTGTDENTTFEYQRNTNWQKFGAEYNEFGELISCGKEPVGKWDSINLDGYEKRDRSNAFWHEGEGYDGCVGGYGQRSDGSGSMRGKWDNVQRGPVLHASQNPEFVPDRSFLSCSREPLTGHDSNMDLTSIEERRGRQRIRRDRDTGRARCASLDTRAISDYSDILGGYSARSRQASVERRGRQRWSKETEETAKDDDHREMCFSSGLGEDDSFQAKRRQAGALLKDLDKSLGQLEDMVENKRKH